MERKINKKLRRDNNLPSPMLALLGLIPVFLFGYLLLTIIAEKKVEYQESKTTPYPYTPVYYAPTETSYRPHAIADIERANRDAQEEMQRLKLQREQLKTQRTFYPF